MAPVEAFKTAVPNAGGETIATLEVSIDPSFIPAPINLAPDSRGNFYLAGAKTT
jgi:hypothetical protein